MKRRDFLKLNLVGIGALVIPPLAVADVVNETKFGSRFLNRKSKSALDNVNDRRLIGKINKDMETSLVFNMVYFGYNDSSSRAEAKDMMDRYFNMMVDKGSLKSFTVICDESNNPVSVVDANKFVMNMDVQSGFTGETYRLVSVLKPESAEFAGMV